MKMFTLRLKPKTIFGLLLVITGIIVIAVTFAANKTGGAQSASAVISASTDAERREYLEKFGWSLAKDVSEKQITVPDKWNDVYSQYNEIQKNQGFDLTAYKGRQAQLYTYTVTNYDSDSEGVVADMLVCDGVLIAGDICNTSASDGFLVGFDGLR